MTSYERNRLNNSKSHIQMPTPASTEVTTATSAAEEEEAKSTAEKEIQAESESIDGKKRDKQAQTEDSPTTSGKKGRKKGKKPPWKFTMKNYYGREADDNVKNY